MLNYCNQIIPIQPNIDEKLQAVVEAGLAEWNGKKITPVQPPAINRGPKQLSDLVAEDRDVDYLP
jgi:hypothetical protein